MSMSKAATTRSRKSNEYAQPIAASRPILSGGRDDRSPDFTELAWRG